MHSKGRLDTPDQIKLDLELQIKNFGPISNDNIRIKSLTIFIGDNNSGKSYAAMLIHSILQAEKYMHISLGRQETRSGGGRMVNDSPFLKRVMQSLYYVTNHRTTEPPNHRTTEPPNHPLGHPLSTFHISCQTEVGAMTNMIHGENTREEEYWKK